MYRTQPLQPPPWLNAHVAPEAASASAMAPDDFRRFVASDYRRRVRSTGLRWNDLYPAYLLALQCHLACWPVMCDDGEQALAQHWEQCRAESRLEWLQARDIVQTCRQVLGRVGVPRRP